MRLGVLSGSSTGGGGGVPIGAVLSFIVTVPTGWLELNGQVVSKSLYPELATALGETAASFALPDFKGRTAVGIGSGFDQNSINRVFGVKEKSGEFDHQLTVSEMPSHSHTGTAASAGAHTHSLGQLYKGANTDGRLNANANNTIAQQINTSSAGAHSHSLSINNAGSGVRHNNVQPYHSVRWAIKALAT